jgi:hypothetical protein
VPALERRHGIRVVAAAAALDAATWHGDDVLVLRLAPDEAIGLGAVGVEVDDEHAIIEEEDGLVAGWFELGQLERHLEWHVPETRPAFAQGAVAGVPAKLWIESGERVLVVTAAAFAHELAGRLP